MRNKKILIFMGVMLAVAGGLSACNSKGTEKSDTQAKDDLSEHIELSIGGINLRNLDEEDLSTEVIKKIEEKFNITLTVKNYETESLNLDLSGGSTTDIVQINDEHIEGVIKGKNAVNLEDYKDIAPNIFHENMEFRNNVMKNFKSNGTDVQYFVTPRVSFDNMRSNYGVTLGAGYVVRWDLYKAIGAPEINNDEDYINALKEMKEIYPETEDGLPVYAMSAYNDAGLHAYFYKGCLAEGYVNLEGGLYVQDLETNNIVSNIYDANDPNVTTAFWSGIKFYNQLYREGLLDPDNFITKSEDLNEKYAKGQYLGGFVNWYLDGYNKNQVANDSETLKQFVVLPEKLGWVNEKNTVGWSGKYFYVSSHSKHIERAILVLDYLQSEEFSRNIDSGVEDRWEMREDGLPYLLEDTVAMKTDPSRADEWQKTGIGASLSDVAGLDTNNVASDGGMISLWYEESILETSLTYAEKDMAKTLGITLPSDLLKNRIEEGKSIDLGNSQSAIRMGLEITPKDILRIDSNCTEITINAIPSLVQAETDAEFEAAKAKLLSDLKDADVETSVEWWYGAWEKSRDAIAQIK